MKMILNIHVDLRSALNLLTGLVQTSKFFFTLCIYIICLDTDTAYRK